MKRGHLNKNKYIHNKQKETTKLYMVLYSKNKRGGKEKVKEK